MFLSVRYGSQSFLISKHSQVWVSGLLYLAGLVFDGTGPDALLPQQGHSWYGLQVSDYPVLS